MNNEENTKLKLKEVHIRGMVANSMTHEEMCVKYGMTISELQHQLMKYKPVIIYSEDEFYNEFSEFIKRNRYMRLFEELSIPYTTRMNLAHGKPIQAKQLIKMLNYFDIKYRINVELTEKGHSSYEFPRYIVKVPSFLVGQRKSADDVTKKKYKKVENIELRSKLVAIKQLEKNIIAQRNTIKQKLEGKGHGIQFINEVLDICDSMSREVSEFSIECERVGNGQGLLDNIAQLRRNAA